MGILSFLAGLPAFWIASKSHSALSMMSQLTAGLLLSTCLNIVIPESIAFIPLEKLRSSSFGPKILTGFVALYSLDTFSKTLTKYFNGVEADQEFDEERSTFNSDCNPELKSFKDYIWSVLSNSTTLGLILHCFTDGIILATSLISQQHNNHSNAFLIILSIFLHKLPAAFSLTSVLLNQQLHNKTVLFHLFLFSISAPIGAYVTYFFSQVFNYSDPNTANSFVLLFSAGAFLYVSFHSFITCHSNSNNNNSKEEQAPIDWNFVVTLIGMLVPVLLTFIHDD